MNKLIALAVLLAVAIGLPLASSCRRSDPRAAVIDIPGLCSARDVRIVTNAALDEVVAACDGIQHDLEMDITKGVVLYHESQALLNPDYQRRIEARLAEVGFPAKVVSVRHNPPALVPTVDGPVQTWPNRYTAAIRLSNAKTQRDANVIADAIAYARIGTDHPGIHADPTTHRLTLRYESLLLSVKNIEHAIAAVGYAANDTPAFFGNTDARPDGWRPMAL